MAAAGAASGAAPAPVASELVVITTDLVKATFDSRGGTLMRLELLKEKEEVVKQWYEPFVELFDSGAKARADAAPRHNVVLFDRTEHRVYEARTGVIGIPGAPNHLTVMNVVPGDRALKDGANDLSISFESPESAGMKLVKTYTFHRGQYTVDVNHELKNVGSAPLASPQIYLQLVRDAETTGGSSFYSTFTGPAVYNDNAKFHKIEFKDIDKGSTNYDKTADSGWIAMVQHYFASAWIRSEAGPREFAAQKLEPNETGFSRRLYTIAEVFTLPAIAPGASHSFKSVLFAGPQEENKLKEIAPGLELVKDYGVFKIIAEPLFWVLTQLHKLIGNWGWAIVGLVVLLKIAFYWLNAKAYASMAKMKAINPRIMELRERMKDKPQQMQQEMMRIYREEKVNPLGGCLPIVVQMPFFIALYWVLLSSVEMRQAPWMGWITDLSAKDPFFILPFLMTLTSLLQTWLNPTPPDPVQARMMWIMPLVFSVMFFFFPAGLVLYWLTNNMLSIAQQYIINKRLGVIGK
ncbi:MAG TPA: membrane protein insertase YidC [Burkholderiaceae bacterium]|nr:membrane protein insertase YidC [Burkholderiaceae bacterium]